MKGPFGTTNLKAGGGEPQRPFIAVSLLLGIGIGISLALLLSLSRLLDWRVESSRPDLAQAHGQVQSLGLIGLFVIGMAIRLITRFGHTKLRLAGLIPPVLFLTASALIFRSLIVIWLPDRLHSLGVLGSEFALLIAAVSFAAVVCATLLSAPARNETWAWFFLTGAMLFVAQSLVGTFTAVYEINDPTRVFSYLPNSARTYLLLAGFMVSFVAGVSGRVLPVLVGRPRSQKFGKLIAALLAVDVIVLAASLLALEHITFGQFFIAMANSALLVLGIIFAAIVWLAAVFRPHRDRLRPVSRPHLWLIRSAFIWLTVAAALSLYMGLRGLSDGALPAHFDLDAMRHALGLGVGLTLISGMGLLILPEFARERMDGASQAIRSYLLVALVNLATLLRVVSALAAPDLSGDWQSGLQTTSGLLVEAAVITFGLSLLRLNLVFGRENRV